MKKTFSFLALAALSVLGCSQATTTVQNSANETPAGQSAVVQGEDKVPAGRFVSAPVADTATLRVKFVFDGDAPKREKIDGSRDPFCADLDILSETMVIGKNGEIKNMVMYLDTRRTKVDLPEIPVPDENPVLDNKGCAFEPHVFAARPGQTVVVKNSDAAGHNANFNFFNNKAVNFLVPANGKKELELKTDEPAPIPVDCNVHPWMRAYIIVMDHPYVGISNEEGVIEIKDLPVGEVTFKLWHENSERSIGEGKVNGKEEKWRSGRMEVELKAGVNDLGTITLSEDQFK